MVTEVGEEEQQENENEETHFVPNNPHGVASSQMTELSALSSSHRQQQQEEDDDGDEEGQLMFISIDDAIDRIGMGMFQYRIMVSAGLCFAADAMEILLLSFLSLVLMDEWNLTDHQASSITASVFAGAFLGTLTLGGVADRLGRRPVFLFTACMISVFGIATACAQTYGQLVFFRFMIGFSVGGIIIPFDTLSEFMPTDRRGQRLVVTSYFWTGATMLVPVLAYFTLGQSSSSTEADNSHQSTGSSNPSWRLFVACCAIPCAISTIVGIYAVPESPRWLLSIKGNSGKALSILRRAAVTNGKDPDLIFPQGTYLEVPLEEEKATVWDLLSPQWRKTTFLLCAIWNSYAFLYYGAIIAVTMVFSSRPTEDTDPVLLGIGSNMTETIGSSSTNQGFQFDYTAMIVSSSAEIAGVTLVLFTVDRFGRIPCQMAYFSLYGLLILALCRVQASSTDDDSQGASHRLSMIVLAFFSRMFVYSGSAIVWIVTAELLTTDIRATGHSVANAFARIGAFSAPYVVTPDTSIMTIGVSMFFISIFNVICTWNLPETNGKPLGLLQSKRSFSMQARSSERIRVPVEEIT